MENNNTEIDLLKDIKIRKIYFSVVEEIKSFAIKSIGYDTRNVDLIENLKHLNTIQNSNHTDTAITMKNKYWNGGSNLNAFNDYTAKFRNNTNPFNHIYPLAEGISTSRFNIGITKQSALTGGGINLLLTTPDMITDLPETRSSETVNLYYIISIEYDIKNSTYINKYQYKEGVFELVQGDYDILKESSGVENLILETIFNIDI